jgi:hypothetical protein
MNQETSQPAPEKSLRDEIEDLLLEHSDAGTGRDDGEGPDKLAGRIMTLLVDRGHYLPGCPPAAAILADAKSFAERLTLSNLALRILNMLAWSAIETPETKPARRWIENYLEGKGHGPVGQAMLWPGNLPGMSQMLRDWGFMPTVATPGQPAYVARAVAPLAVN